MPERRHRFSISQKVAIIREQERTGSSNKSICQHHGIQQSQLKVWKENADDFRFRSERLKSLNSGRPSVFVDGEQALLAHVLRRREQSCAVTIRSIVWKLGELFPGPLDRTFATRRRWVYRFISRHGLTIRKVTRHVSFSDEVLR
jgi:transposase-like protein